MAGEDWYNGENSESIKRLKILKLMESGKTDPKEEPLFDKERIHLNEKAIKILYVSGKLLLNISK